LYDAHGKWGARFGDFVGAGLFEGRRVDGLDIDKVMEFPWPLVWKAARDRLFPRGRGRWLSVNSAFDSWAARQIRRWPSDIFVGTATSDLYCLETAKRNGSTLVHDCPGLHPEFEFRLLSEAADRAGMRLATRIKRGGMQARKLHEYSLADILMIYSDFHRKGFESAGIPRDRLFMSPLWVDPFLWFRDAPERLEATPRDRPLKVLYVGSIDLRKGIPFLLKAIDECGNAVQLTIVGPRNPDAASVLGRERHNVQCLNAQPKSQLRKIYAAHDLLVLPSVGDSFGFVALEAMACSLPVIVTENCGAPVPEASWRIPAMDPTRLAARIMQYADDRAWIVQHGRQASAFATQFGPEKYRHNIRILFDGILNRRNGLEPANASAPEPSGSPAV
jgi:glycosyltransferase involved in cell wall biosynthesis